MTDKELIEALRCCVSSPERDGCRSTCVFFNGDINWCIPEMGKAVSDRLEALLAENERLWDSARRLWSGMPRYCGDLPRFAMHAAEPPSTEGVE